MSGPPPPDPSPPGSSTDVATVVLDAWILFGALVVLLAVFVVGVMIIQAVRRRRHQARKPEQPAALADPWSESARRIKP